MIVGPAAPGRVGAPGEGLGAPRPATSQSANWLRKMLVSNSGALRYVSMMRSTTSGLEFMKPVASSGLGTVAPGTTEPMNSDSRADLGDIDSLGLGQVAGHRRETAGSGEHEQSANRRPL